MKTPHPTPALVPSPTPATDIELVVEAPVHRRAFLGWVGIGSTATVLAGTLPPATAKAVTRRILNRNPLMLEDLTHATFAPLVGEVFLLKSAAGLLVTAILAEATPSPQSIPVRSEARRAPFSLLFRVASTQPLAQQIYQVEHAALGRLDIFLVPVGREGDALLLEAIFN